VRPFVLLALVLALLAAGCDGGGGDGNGGGTTETTTGPSAPTYEDEPAAGKTVERLVQAAGKTNYATMFNLLTAKSRQRYGPTRETFARGPGRQLAVVLGALARAGGSYEPVLAKRMSDWWAVAAVSGSVMRSGQSEYGAYAVPLTREGGEWRIELAGTVTFNPLTPEAELRAGSRPNISTEVNASEPILDSAVFVDDTVVLSTVSPDELLLTADVENPLDKGRHTIVTYAETQSGAGANAYSFEVG